MLTWRSDLTGMRFGRWTVLSKCDPPGNGRPQKWLCKCDCGSERCVQGRSLRKGKSESCGCTRSDPRLNKRGANHRNWRGGRHRTKHGYVSVQVVRIDRELRSRVLEHVHVMEQFLGRRLRPGENVHHKNGVRDDNRIENLELWTTRQPSGKRVVDMVEFAESILSEYAPDRLARQETK